MSLSSESLFRFLTRFEYLEDALIAGFPFREQCEELHLTGYSNNPFDRFGIVKNELHSWAVCFCDIPLGQSERHREQYGDYSIALTKEWAMANGITPIRYYHRNSPDFASSDKMLYMDLYHQLTSQKISIFDVLSELTPKDAPTEKDWSAVPYAIRTLHGSVNELFLSLLEHIYLTMHLTRIHDGGWEDRNSKETTFRKFYDEREWRAISSGPTNRISFELKDLRHVIVKTDAEKEAAVAVILAHRDRYKVSDEKKIWSIVKTGAEIYPDA